MDAELLSQDRKGVTEFSRERLRFLETDPSVRFLFWEKGIGTKFIYVGEDLTVEFILDWKEHTADLLLCRTVDGNPPPGFYEHDGVLMRSHIATLLRQGSDEDAAIFEEARDKLASLQGATGRKSFSQLAEEVSVLAALLRDNQSRVMTLALAVFR